jgi:hypothetical protein
MSLILDGTNGLSDVDGSAATPAIRGSDANTGVFFGSDVVGLSTGGSERVRVDASGNVGIGTSSPANYANYKTLTIQGPSGGTGAEIDLKNPSGTTVGAIYSTATDFVIASDFTNAIASSTLRFDVDGTERMRIDSSGNILVNRTTQFLDGQYSSDFNGNSKRGATYNNTFGSGANFISFGSAGTQIGTIQQSGGSNVSYITSSDYRLKENVQPMRGALAKVSALSPCTFKWKIDGSDGQGFIAHELQEVVPDCVSGEKDAVDADGNPQYQGIDTSFLVATLTAAIQEQQAIITALTARVEALEGAQA